MHTCSYSTLRLFAVLLVSCALWTGCGMQPAQSSVPQVGVVAPDFSYERLDGTSQRLSASAGKRVVLNFWATWCAPCREEMPILEAASQRYDTALVVAINSFDDADDIRAYADELGVTFPLVLDASGDVGRQYRAQMLPITYLIDDQGTIAKVIRGPVDRSTLDAFLGAAR